jgi:hypothetical protein
MSAWEMDLSMGKTCSSQTLNQISFTTCISYIYEFSPFRELGMIPWIHNLSRWCPDIKSRSGPIDTIPWGLIDLWLSLTSKEDRGLNFRSCPSLGPMVLHGIWYCMVYMVWYDVVCCGMVFYCMVRIWYGIVWYTTFWYGMM